MLNVSYITAKLCILPRLRMVTYKSVSCRIWSYIHNLSLYQSSHN